jgi:hypothetical protein
MLDVPVGLEALTIVRLGFGLSGVRGRADGVLLLLTETVTER